MAPQVFIVPSWQVFAHARWSFCTNIAYISNVAMMRRYHIQRFGEEGVKMGLKEEENPPIEKETKETKRTGRIDTEELGQEDHKACKNIASQNEGPFLSV